MKKGTGHFLKVLGLGDKDPEFHSESAAQWTKKTCIKYIFMKCYEDVMKASLILGGLRS